MSMEPTSTKTVSEQELIAFLHHFSVTITESRSQYSWQCHNGSGIAPDLVSAVNQALSFLIDRVVVQHYGDGSYKRWSGGGGRW
jgi:hypothetical protein